MKKIFILSCLFCLLGFSSNAQVKKADIEQSLTEMGLTIKDLKKVVVFNIYKYMSDGSISRTYSVYNSASNKIYEFSMTDSGFKIKYSSDGTSVSMVHIPFSEINHVILNTGETQIIMSN